VLARQHETLWLRGCWTTGPVDAPGEGTSQTPCWTGVRQLGLIGQWCALLLARARLMGDRSFPDFTRIICRDIGGLAAASDSDAPAPPDWKAFDLAGRPDAPAKLGRTSSARRGPPLRIVTTPLGRKIAIDLPVPRTPRSPCAARVFGTTRPPMIAGKPTGHTFVARAAVRAGQDRFAGFWAGSIMPMCAGYARPLSGVTPCGRSDGRRPDARGQDHAAPKLQFCRGCGQQGPAAQPPIRPVLDKESNICHGSFGIK